MLKSVAVVSTLTLACQQALASGFQVNEYSASGLGRAFAGEGAIADSAAVNARNPAALTLFKKAAISGGATFIDPSVDIEVTSATAGDSGYLSDGAASAYIPNMHMVYPINDKFAVGFSSFANFGLSTDYNKKIAGLIGAKTELMSIDFNLNLGYRLNDAWSVGVGVNADYGDANLERYAPPAMGGAAVSKLSGDGWGYGWNAGVLWELSKTDRLALTYRSKIDLDLEGEYKGAATITPGATVPGAMTLNLPEIWELSGFHQLTPTFAMHYSAMRTNWSSFQQMLGTGDQCTGGICIQKDEDWKDAWRLAVGSTITVNSKWKVRSGVAYDKSPVPSDKRTVSIPDTDRFWLSLGATYQATPKLTVDAGFAYLMGEKHTSSTEVAGPATYTFNSSGDAALYGLSFNYEF